jgi:putative component of membrane protein insertase Oxa1/YidC/SpoIIIJ protein YidD
MLRCVLLAVIRFYRRHLSGRGPLRRVRCTFAGLESCSAYGERIVQETPSAWMAMRRILRRLRRCRHLSLYHLKDGKFGWGCDYDVALGGVCVEEAARRMDSALAADGEGTRVRTSVVRATLLVATAVGQTVAPAAGSSPLPLIRSGTAVQQLFAQRQRQRMLASVAAAALGTVAVFLNLGTVVIALCFLLAGMEMILAMSARRILRRLSWLEVLSAIEGPAIHREGGCPASRTVTSMRTG